MLRVGAPFKQTIHKNPQTEESMPTIQYKLSLNYSHDPHVYRKGKKQKGSTDYPRTFQKLSNVLLDTCKPNSLLIPTSKGYPLIDGLFFCTLKDAKTDEETLEIVFLQITLSMNSHTMKGIEALAQAFEEKRESPKYAHMKLNMTFYFVNHQENFQTFTIPDFPAIPIKFMKLGATSESWEVLFKKALLEGPDKERMKDYVANPEFFRQLEEKEMSLRK